ncbi:MAG TPA: polysaccharide biosynthesis/export family protein [Candidatus Nitrosopolaris sp.]|nr:polysaccharide biosynthesis/export family protein [Candidatus Nitrosopolaris sp.]
MATRTRTVTILVALGCCLGCAMRSNSGKLDDSKTAGTAAARVADLMSARDHERLAGIVAERAATPTDGGYRIGPDDLLEIRIPDLLDAGGRLQQARLVAATQGVGAALPTVAEAPLFEEGVRVSERGDIMLPLLGVVPAGGRTPTELAQDLGARLKAAGILRDPQVSVNIIEHRSHVVAVVGSVERPGLYPLTRPRATLADLIWAAGGPNKDAGRVVAFVPVSGATPVVSDAAPDLDQLSGADPVHVDLDLLLHAGGAEAHGLNPQVRPGDLISVSPAGTVQVDGWVDKPGSYPVTRSLTLTGAVAAAGGNLFPADLHHVTVKRVLGAGEQRYFTVDLDQVADGRAPDLPVSDGDVVRLPASIPRLVPYGGWALLKALVHVGGTVTVF